MPTKMSSPTRQKQQVKRPGSAMKRRLSNDSNSTISSSGWESGTGYTSSTASSCCGMISENSPSRWSSTSSHSNDSSKLSEDSSKRCISRLLLEDLQSDSDIRTSAALERLFEILSPNSGDEPGSVDSGSITYAMLVLPAPALIVEAMKKWLFVYQQKKQQEEEEPQEEDGEPPTKQNPPYEEGYHDPYNDNKTNLSEDIQYYGCLCLTVLVAETEDKTTFLECNAQRVVMDAMKAFPDSLEVQGMACNFLKHFFRPPTIMRDLKTFVEDYKGLPLVAAAMRKFPHEDIVQRHCCGLLDYLALRKKNHIHIMKAGLVSLVAMALEHHLEDDDVRENAGFFLNRISLRLGYSDARVENGALVPIEE